jgi:hypothetical protein
LNFGDFVGSKFHEYLRTILLVKQRGMTGAHFLKKVIRTSQEYSISGVGWFLRWQISARFTRRPTSNPRNQTNFGALELTTALDLPHLIVYSFHSQLQSSNEIQISNMFNKPGYALESSGVRTGEFTFKPIQVR